jgi:ketosteroid isomerase-like protein
VKGPIVDTHDNRTIGQIDKLASQWVAAERTGDAAALDRLLTDDFVGIGPPGFMLIKEQWLTRYGPDGLRNDSFALEETRVRTYGDAAIVTGQQVQSGTFQGRALPPGGRATLVWMQGNGQWRLAGWQLSPIAAGAEQ